MIPHQHKEMVVEMAVAVALPAAEAAVVVLALVVLLVDPQLEEQVVLVFKFQQRSEILNQV